MNTQMIRKLSQRIEQLEHEIENQGKLSDKHLEYWRNLIIYTKWKYYNPEADRRKMPEDIYDAYSSTKGTPRPSLWGIHAYQTYQFDYLLMVVIDSGLDCIETGEFSIGELESQDTLEYAVEWAKKQLADENFLKWYNAAQNGPEPKRIESTPVEDDLIEDDSPVSSEIEPEPEADTRPAPPQQQSISESGIVSARYIGAVTGYSILTTSGVQLVVTGKTYELTTNVWQNLKQNPSKYQIWEKVS